MTQFRAVVARTGIAAYRVQALTSAMDRYARSDDFNAYLREQLASPDSYIAASQALGFVGIEFESMRRLAVDRAGSAK